jgi:hypothetical protein
LQPPTGSATSAPIMGHALIEPAILLGRPVALIAPYFKVGARLIERRCGAA